MPHKIVFSNETGEHLYNTYLVPCRRCNLEAEVDWKDPAHAPAPSTADWGMVQQGALSECQS